MLNSGMFTSDTSEWATPQDFFDKLNAEFHFTLDPCATPENAKCGKFYTKEQNGLAQDWTGETVFCNPPYGKEIATWASGGITTGQLQQKLFDTTGIDLRLDGIDFRKETA